VDAVAKFMAYGQNPGPRGLYSHNELWELGREAFNEQDQHIRAMIIMAEQYMSPDQYQVFRNDLARSRGEDFNSRYVGV